MKIDLILAFFKGVSQFRANFQESLQTIFARLDKTVNALELCR